MRSISFVLVLLLAVNAIHAQKALGSDFYSEKAEHFKTLVEIPKQECRSFFERTHVEIGYGQDYLAQWLNQNCKIFSPALGTYYNADSINWFSQDSKGFFDDPWACTDSTSWALYYPSNCSWVYGSYDNGCQLVLNGQDGNLPTIAQYLTLTPAIEYITDACVAPVGDNGNAFGDNGNGNGNSNAESEQEVELLVEGNGLNCNLELETEESSITVINGGHGHGLGDYTVESENGEGTNGSENSHGNGNDESELEVEINVVTGHSHTGSGSTTESENEFESSNGSGNGNGHAHGNDESEVEINVVTGHSHTGSGSTVESETENEFESSNGSGNGNGHAHGNDESEVEINVVTGHTGSGSTVESETENEFESSNGSGNGNSHAHGNDETESEVEINVVTGHSHTGSGSTVESENEFESSNGSGSSSGSGNSNGQGSDETESEVEINVVNGHGHNGSGSTVESENESDNGNGNGNANGANSNGNANGANSNGNGNDHPVVHSGPRTKGHKKHHMGPQHIRHGSSYFYYNDNYGDLIYEYIGKYGSQGDDSSEAVMLDYNYSSIDDTFESYFDYATAENFVGDETVITGCSGWWAEEDIDLTDPSSIEANWYLDNCDIVDPFTALEVPADEVNFATLRGQSLLYGDWRCSSGNNRWRFDFETCSWINICGSQSLIEVKNNHRIFKENYLGF